MAGIDALSALLGGTGTTPTNDITAFNQQVLAQDPFGIAGKSIDSWNPNMSTWSPATSGITSFTKNFLSGLLGATAQSDAADQIAKVRPLIADLQGPNSANIAVPDGVDAGPFNTFAANEAEKGQTTNQEIRKAFANVGLTLNPDGTASQIKMDDGSDVSDFLTQSKLDAKANAAGGQKIQQQTAQKLSSIIQGITALNHNGTQIDAIPEYDTLNPIDQYNPNSALSVYRNSLPFLSLPLGGAMQASGRGTAAANQILGALNPHVGSTTDTLKSQNQAAIDSLVTNGQTYLSTLKNSAYNPDAISALESQLNDAINGKADNSYLTPKTTTSQTLDPDTMAQAKAEAQAMAAVGTPPDQIAAALRSKYGGQ